MQINKPPSSGTPSAGSSANSSAPDKANRAENPLVRLVGQLVSAQVVQSKAVQVAAAQAAVLQAGITARLTQEPSDSKAPASSATPPSTAPAPAPAPATPTQTQYQTTLQIGNERVVVMTDQPLPAGAQLLLKVSSPQALQLVEQPAITTPPVAPDVASNLLNTLLRQALPLQQPVAALLKSIAANLLLPNAGASPTNVSATVNTATTGNTANALVTSGLNIPSGLAPSLIAALKPLLSQIIGSQLTVDTVTEPDALRNAITNSGLFREARLLQWAQAMLKQFPDLVTRGNVAPDSTGNPVPTGSSAPQPTASSTIAQAAASLLTSQTSAPPTANAAQHTPQATQNLTAQNTLHASLTLPSLQQAIPLAGADDLLDAKQADVIHSAIASASTVSQSTLHDAINTNTAGADDVDVDVLRNELLKALSARAQKNQPAFAGTTTSSGINAETARITTETTRTVAGIPVNAVGNSAYGAGTPVNAPINAKTATASLPVATGVSADTKTTLEKLVSVTSQQLLTNSGVAANSPVSEEQVLAILRQLPMPQTPELHATVTRGKPQEDDSQWLLQLLRGSFGALKHLQLQQATNLNATPTAPHAGNDNPLPPLQIELPILVAQQWHNVNIEIDRRAPESKPESTQTERSWRVTLRFELPQQGIIVAQLNLSGVLVTATLWAEKQVTCQLLQQQLKELSERLGKVGAHVTTLDVRHGQPPSAKTRIEQRLIDVRT